MAAPTSPANIARYGHRVGMYLDSNGSLQSWVDRVQLIEPDANADTQIYFEMGNVDPVGFSQAPTAFTMNWEENVVQAKSDFIMANTDTSSGSPTYNLSNIINNQNLINSYILMRANGATQPSSQLAFTNMAVEELMWNYQVRNPVTFRPRLRGTLGKWYTAGNLVTPNTWGSPNTTSPGAIRGRDARIFFFNSTGKGYRIQSFQLRVTFPITPVEELGTRALVGLATGAPEVFLDYDLLTADDQPHDQWATLTSGYYDFNNLIGGNTVWIALYDPVAAEGSLLIRSWKLDNVVAVRTTPIRGQVRGLTTVRYQLRVAKAAVSGSGGFTTGKGLLVP
jgi:hypothetical protein